MIVLVLGGARSGKSVVAERQASALAGDEANVTYVATALKGRDADLDVRIAEHRERRPEWWTTVEVGADLAGALRRADASSSSTDSVLGSAPRRKWRPTLPACAGR